jgi:hypothetical protein
LAANGEQPASLTLPYRPGADGRPRPLLWIDVHGPSATELVPGLIDSGADYSCFPLGYAPLLGYQASDLALEHGSQVGGAIDFRRAEDPMTAYIAGDADREFGFEVHPNFVEGADMILLGRLDFMMSWIVVIDEPAKEFTLIRVVT